VTTIDADQRGGDSQLRRGLRAIEALAVQPHTAAGLARELGVNRSTALRLLRVLEEEGYVVRDGRSKQFSTIVQRLYGLVASHDDHSDWGELIHPILALLRDEFGEATALAVPANGMMVYMAFFASLHPVAVRERIGTVRPMQTSAVGKAYLSGLDPKSLDLELGRMTYEGGTERAVKGPIELRQRLDEVRAQGYAIDQEETFKGVACVAAPVTIMGSLVGAVGLSGPTYRLSPPQIEKIGEHLVAELVHLNGRL